MSKLTDSFIRGFGSSLGRAAARKTIQSGGNISPIKTLLVLLILFLLFLGLVQIAGSYNRSHPSKFVTFKVKGSDNGYLPFVKFLNSKGYSKGMSSPESYQRINGELVSIPDSLRFSTKDVYVDDAIRETITIESDGYETQTIKVDNRDTISVILNKISNK
jgi:hypothetical protein